MPIVRALSRQVNFHLPAEDMPLLEAQVQEHGSIKNAIVFALRLAEHHRLEGGGPAPKPPEPKPGRKPSKRRPTPAPDPGPGPGGSEWWVPIEFVAEVLGRKANTLRRWGDEGRAEIRGQGRNQEVDLESVQVERTLAARVLMIKSRTLAAWTEDGRAKQNSKGLYVVGELELPVARAAREYGLSKSDLAKHARETSHGPVVRVLDAIAAIDGGD